VNIGGFSNLSALFTNKEPLGFDCGPGNALLDAWIFRHQGLSMDQDGAWARSGQLNAILLSALLEHPFFKLTPPRSTGREDFNLAWLDEILHQIHAEALPSEDVQRTLLELTAQAIANAISKFTPELEEVLVCGGGAYNRFLMQRLGSLLAPRLVRATGEMGIAEDQVEALAFAWLAQRTLMGEAGNLSSVTGARGLRVLGAIYPA
jgi:anhydro-N-acetylmuramic acid kinase